MGSHDPVFASPVHPWHEVFPGQGNITAAIFFHLKTQSAPAIKGKGFFKFSRPPSPSLPPPPMGTGFLRSPATRARSRLLTSNCGYLRVAGTKSGGPITLPEDVG